MVARFLEEGATVVATACSHPERLLTDFPAVGDRLAIERVDVTNEVSVQELAAAAGRGGDLYAVVYNAGIIRDQPVLGMEDEDWQRVLEVNLTGAFRVGRAFGKLFFRKKAGRLLFVSSVAGRQGGRGQANYAASKAGLEGFVRSLAADLAPRGVLVNALAPGPIESRMTRDVMTLAGEEVVRRIALKRLGQPAEVAALAAHLLAPDLTWLTGQVIAIDGGFNL
ncbi:MAG: 3-oxoacyl-[acyl-carrier protein] reductase [Candidatus Ozemobacter sibiricus]|uniref:3-oxoacyl-[acyl-carrier protein] reductase n=1 Tax=Candidatus Ozemobacter sibiricus TaxID=2268124 RepID=A0A367ZU82_9BACT|nr:MAG: 3-oxoacyl-[acyl-carrier protein] reductase [Candidatus Ozemobacter sibiricus]